MGSGQSLSACYRTWKARGRPASRRTSSTVDVLALRHSLQWDGGDGGTMAKKDAVSKRLALEIAVAKRIKKWRGGKAQKETEKKEEGAAGPRGAVAVPGGGPHDGGRAPLPA